MFCSKCGTELNEDAIYCVKCGSKVGTSTNASHTITVSDNKKIIIVILVIVLLSLSFIGLTLIIISQNHSSSNELDISTGSAETATNTAAGNDEIVEELHFLSGVYVKSGYEHRSGWTGDIQDYRKYCVEFSSDGTAVWWENAIYGSPQYSVGSYDYNKENNYFILKLEDYTTKTLIVCLGEECITIKGGKFDNVVFSKENYKDISEAISDTKKSNSSDNPISTTSSITSVSPETSEQSTSNNLDGVVPSVNDVYSLVDLILGSNIDQAKSLIENTYQGSKYVMSLDHKYYSNVKEITIKGNKSIDEFSINWDFCILRTYSITNTCYEIQYYFGDDDYGNGKKHNKSETENLYKSILSIANNRFGEPDETDAFGDFCFIKWFNYDNKNITLGYWNSDDGSLNPGIYLLFSDNSFDMNLIS